MQSLKKISNHKSSEIFQRVIFLVLPVVNFVISYEQRIFFIAFGKNSVYLLELFYITSNFHKVL